MIESLQVIINYLVIFKFCLLPTFIQRFLSGMSFEKIEMFEGVDIKEEMTDDQPVNTTSSWSSSVCNCKCKGNSRSNNLEAEAVLCNQFETGSEHSNQVGEVAKVEDVKKLCDVLAKAEPLDYKELQCDK